MRFSAPSMLFWRSVTSKWPLADLIILGRVARFLLRQASRKKRTVGTEECRQTADFTSAGSVGITSTLDQQCFIEFGTD